MPDIKDELLKQGIEEFNKGEFFECHETLEDFWRTYDGTDRECVQGIIQIAVAYYHLGRGNELGALKLFRRGLARVERFTPECFGLQTDTFCAAVGEHLRNLETKPTNSVLELKLPQLRPMSN